MNIFYDCNTLEEYIASKKDVLVDFGVFKYCSRQELNELANATSEIHADRITRKLIERYLEDVESEDKLKSDKCLTLTEIEASNLCRKTRNAIMRNRIFTFQSFLDHVNKNGWGNLRGLGDVGAKEVFMNIYPDKSEKEINDIVWKYRKVG